MDDPTLLSPIDAPASSVVADHRAALTLRGIQADTAAQSVMIAEYRSRLAPKTHVGMRSICKALPISWPRLGS